MADTAKNLQNFTKLGLGLRVDKATATLPQTAASTLFTVTVGRVLVNLIIGEVTTIIQVIANATKLVNNPTPAGASSDLCATLDINADAVGAYYTISGVAADALRDALYRGVGMTAPIIIGPGTIDLDCAGSATGSVKWSIWYLPLDEGAVLA